MRFLHGCLNYITRKPCLPPSENALQVQAKVIAHLKRTGRITIEDCRRLGTSYGTKIIFRLREKGLLHPVGHPCGERWAKNANGKGRHKVYLLKREGGK